jgi:hypothetical protein
MFVVSVVLSGRGLCDELITRPEKSYRLWCVVVCDLEPSRMGRPWPTLGRSATKKKPILTCVFNFNENNYSFCLMVEASNHGYVLHTRRIHVTRYRIRIQHQRRLAILNLFSVLIYAVCHILPSFVSYQGCVVHRWVFGVPWYTSLMEWKYVIQFSNE